MVPWVRREIWMELNMQPERNEPNMMQPNQPNMTQPNEIAIINYISIIQYEIQTAPITVMNMIMKKQKN